ncbi:hypothetical protein [Streptomyces sp. NPDC000410]|uniref:hypothetical protein n=1 Tax=Streptomyces sp. NPDC000410 TaxID=3154254 RepID=UPI003319A60A
MRLVRAGAGRHAVRAVRVLLFVAGLMVLGFVLGGQAQAAEQPATGLGAGSGTERVRDVAVERVAESVVETVPDKVAEPVESVARAVTEPVQQAGPVVERVLQPVVRPAEHAVERAVERAVPERLLPASGLDGAAAAVTAPVRVPASAPALAHGADLPQATDPVTDRRDAPRPAPAYAYVFAHQASESYAAAPTAVLGAPADGPLLPQGPRRAPAGPGAAAVVAHASDSHTPRPGDRDPQAAMFSDAVTFGLIAGSRQAVAGTPVRDRHRDILEFPG